MSSKLENTLGTFSAKADPTTVSSRWNSYIKRFKMMLIANNIKNDGQKKAILIHQGGEELFNAYEGLAHRGIEDMGFTDTVAELTQYFSPKMNRDYLVHCFRKIKQEEGETMDCFHNRLRQYAKNCEFENEAREIKQQIIENCSSNKIRKQALKENIALDDILQLARATEVTELQIKDIECSKPRNVSLVDMKNNFKKKPTIKKCYRCGGTFPHQGFDCPAIGKRCSNCKKMNHFAKVCRSKSSPEQIREIEIKVSSTDTDDENFE